MPYCQTGVTEQDADLHIGSAAQVNTVLFTRTITLPGYYDLKAEQDVHIYCNNILPEVSATAQLFVNGQLVGNEDNIRGGGVLETTLTALAELQLLKPGDVVQARYKFDKWKSGGFGPTDASWDLLPKGRLTVQLLADFPPRGRVHLADWLPDMLQRDFVKSLVQIYGLTQTTYPYTGAVTFRRTAVVLDNPAATGLDWSARRDSSQPAKRSWKLGDFAQRNWFRWKEDDANTAYAHVQWDQAHTGIGWNGDATKKAALAFAAGYLDNGADDTSLDATKDVLTLPFAASVVGEECYSSLLEPESRQRLPSRPSGNSGCGR